MTMTFTELVFTLGLTVGGMTVGVSLCVVGVDRFVTGLRDWRRRLAESWRYFAALGIVLVLNRVARMYGPRFSWFLGLNITSLIHRIEGNTVAAIQSIASPELTAVFGFVYVYGYTFLLVFPVVAYFILDDPGPLQRTLVTYVLNYAVGVALYTLFVAYGPRNLMPDMVEPLLFAEYPSTKLLMSRVNNNTNVFPSLHTSLATSVALLAWRTRDEFFWWPPLAIPLAVGVGFATMYLGIHWATDVFAGICLGVASVRIATRLVE